MPTKTDKFVLVFATAMICVAVLKMCDVDKPKLEEATPIAVQDTITRAMFTIINHDGRQMVKKVWNPVLQDSVVWKVWHNEIETETLYVHTGVEEFDKIVKPSADTLFFPNENIPFAWVMRADTLGNITICYPPTASAIGDSSASYLDLRNLKVKLVDGRWDVKSALPVRIKLNDGYLESCGDSLAMGFEYSDIANEYDELIAKLKAIKRRNTNIDTNYIRVERPKIKWREEKIWSTACQCSLVVRRWYNRGDSSATIYYRSGIADTSDPRDAVKQ